MMTWTSCILSRSNRKGRGGGGGGRVQHLMWSGPSPKSGLFYVTSKGGNIDFPPLSPPCNVVPMFELPKEKNKHPNFEWRG